VEGVHEEDGGRENLEDDREDGREDGGDDESVESQVLQQRGDASDSDVATSEEDNERDEEDEMQDDAEDGSEDDEAGSQDVEDERGEDEVWMSEKRHSGDGEVMTVIIFVT